MLALYWIVISLILYMLIFVLMYKNRSFETLFNFSFSGGLCIPILIFFIGFMADVHNSYIIDRQSKFELTQPMVSLDNTNEYFVIGIGNIMEHNKFIPVYYLQFKDNPQTTAQKMSNLPIIENDNYEPGIYSVELTKTWSELLGLMNNSYSRRYEIIIVPKNTIIRVESTLQLEMSN